MKISPKRGVPFARGARLFQRMYTRLGCQGRPPRFAVEFFPYANLTHTIRLVEDTAYVRLSDVFRAAPLGVLEATAAILLARVYRQRAPQRFFQAYREFSLARTTRRRLMRVRRQRLGARRSGQPRGAHYDLGALFENLNRQYFGEKLRQPRMGWSARPWRTQLGCFDPALDQIILSSRLDREAVPPYAVEYVLFHEMLHVKHPLRRASCGLQAHSPEFRAQEKRFAHYESARRYLTRLR